MISKLLEDAQKRPELFQLSGHVHASSLENWLLDRHLSIPTDLKSFWSDTGGGEIFETETILSPFGRAEVWGNVDSVNEFHWEKGMPRDYLVFHVGLIGLTCVRLSVGDYVSISEESYELKYQFASLADWYDNFICAEYAARYGLDD